MSKLYVPPGMDYKKYMNLATINGIDVGVSTPTYGNGASIRDFTVANALYTIKPHVADTPPTPENGWALEFTNYGSKFSFQMNDPAVIFFETFVTVNPTNSQYNWGSDGDYVEMYFVHDGVGILGSTTIYNPVGITTTCGPFLAEFVAQIPDGQSDLYICAWWKKQVGTATGFKQMSVRVNVLGFLQ